MINQLTVSLRLHTLLVRFMDWQRTLAPELQLLIDDRPPSAQVAAVLLLAVVYLAIAVAILEWRQFPPSEES